jgi:glycosyltransferase involved in cell wall biosynthesis
MTDHADIHGRHVAFFSWRDTHNPEGGGAERYLEKMAEGLVARGARVTVFCAAHAAAPPDENVNGVRFVRRGTKLTVYQEGFTALARRRLGHVDLVIDVQNGMPFMTRAATRAPVVVLVHHVHREQWPVVYPGLVGKLGWAIEHRVAPRLYRSCQYVAVSRATRDELVELGVDRRRIAVVHNGTDPVAGTGAGKSSHPSIAVVGRLVPHKQVEHAIDAALTLREHHPDLRLHVVGSGWWEAELYQHALERNAGDTVVFEGHVEESRKHELFENAWALALPSLKEGWGLVVGEAGMHHTPTVAYASAGGTRESITHGRSGLLVHEQHELVDALGMLLDDDDLRRRLGDGAFAMSHQFTWEHAQESFAHVLASVLRGGRVDAQDPDEA